MGAFAFCHHPCDTPDHAIWYLCARITFVHPSSYPWASRGLPHAPVFNIAQGVSDWRLCCSAPTAVLWDEPWIRWGQSFFTWWSAGPLGAHGLLLGSPWKVIKVSKAIVGWHLLYRGMHLYGMNMSGFFITAHCKRLKNHRKYCSSRFSEFFPRKFRTGFWENLKTWTCSAF